MESEGRVRSRGRGRPRAFDREMVLRQAMEAFWAKGFHACSVSDLVDAMGINSPSIYAVFGDKEALYRQTIELYANGEGGVALERLREGATLREGIEAMFDASIELFTAARYSRGCMLFFGGASIGTEHAELRKFLQRLRQRVTRLVEARFKAAVEQGELPPHADAEALATVCMLAFSGLSAQAANGAKKNELRIGITQLLSLIPFQT